MATIEWFRRTSWTDGDREEFNARLNRSHKAQYLRIQAVHLAEAGLHQSAIELLDRLFAEFPERIELAQAEVDGPAYSERCDSKSTQPGPQLSRTVRRVQE